MIATRSASWRFVWFATAVAALGGFLFGYDTAVVNGAIPYLNPSVGPALTFAAYSAVSLLAFVFVGLYVPETKGRTLEEIETIWT